MVLVTKVMVYFDVELSAIYCAQDHFVEIGRAGCGIINCRLWIQINNSLPYRVDEVGIDHIGNGEVLAIAGSIHMERFENLLLNWLTDGTPLRRVRTEHERIPEVAVALRRRRHKGVDL